MADLGKFRAPEEIGRIRTLALGVGGIAAIIWAVGLYFNPEQGLRSWLLGYIFWGGIGLGCLGILMLQYLTGGAWGVVSRRVLEAGSRTLPIIILLFVPLAIGVYTRNFFEWTHLPPTEHIMEHRGIYMTTWFWVVRSVIYFAFFGVMVVLLNRWSIKQDETTTLEESRLVL